MGTEQFYTNLPAFADFSDVGRAERYAEAPRDWYVIITDVKGSTKAIEQGRYKEVNLLGAASITAILNISNGIEIPFVFGGDGATMLILPSLYSAAREALAGTRELAREGFEMELRVGIVPLEKLPPVLVAKHRMSDECLLAVFSGGGVSEAERLVKDTFTGPLYLVTEKPRESPNFGGLTCRWNDVKSIRGETISLLVKAFNKHDYKSVIKKIEEYYGDEAAHHPIHIETLEVSGMPGPALLQTKLHAGLRGALYKYFFYLKSRAVNLFLRQRKLTRYKQVLRRTSDYRKFDDALRMVLSGTAEARKKLEEFLEVGHRAGKWVYGIHASDRALMTCLVFETYGRQVHFVDAADGGYALAAKRMKAQAK